MDASIGVNLRVTAHSNQGGRKYMEDMFCVAYQPTADEKDLLYAYFGIFDGHGGREAALYAKTHLMDHIVSQKNFWSEEDELVLRSIKDGFISVHQAMWRELDKWPKTQSGLPSTSGTTASVAFVRRGKLYLGHVGDSGIVLGYQDPNSNFWKAKPLTMDHKPENPVENARIQECGGKVVSKSGVPRVVWNRPRLGHKGPVRRSTLIDEIPFLAVARSLGDLWSYNSEQNEFVVSPVPDTAVIEIDVNTHRCLILGSDGLWNMLSSQDAVNSVYFAEKNNERQNQAAALGHLDATASQKNWINPSKRLVDRALDRWISNNLRADNTSVVTVVIDPPGPPRVPKTPSPRNSTCSTATYERSPSLSRLASPGSPTNNNGVISRLSRPIAQTRYAPIEKIEPSNVQPPTATSPPRHAAAVAANRESPNPSQKQQQLEPVKKGVGKAPTCSSSKLKSVPATVSPQQSPRDLPMRARRHPQLLSSKTSRVMQFKPIVPPGGVTSNSFRKTTAPLISPSSSQTNIQSQPTPGIKLNDDQVQINEISSSCEWRNDSLSDLNDSIQATQGPPTGSGNKSLYRKCTKRALMCASLATGASTSSALQPSDSKGRKRVSRQSVKDESTVSPVKLVKISQTNDKPAEDSSNKRQNLRTRAPTTNLLVERRVPVGKKSRAVEPSKSEESSSDKGINESTSSILDTPTTESLTPSKRSSRFMPLPAFEPINNRKVAKSKKRLNLRTRAPTTHLPVERRIPVEKKSRVVEPPKSEERSTDKGPNDSTSSILDTPPTESFVPSKRSSRLIMPLSALEPIRNSEPIKSKKPGRPLNQKNIRNLVAPSPTKSDCLQKTSDPVGSSRASLRTHVPRPESAAFKAASSSPLKRLQQGKKVAEKLDVRRDISSPRKGPGISNDDAAGRTLRSGDHLLCRQTRSRNVNKK